MGVLDDAIREHLELKRRHGVPDEELERQQEEALGPARRDVSQQHEEAELAPGQPATAERGDGAPPDQAQESELFDMEGDAAAEHPSVVDEPRDLGEGPAAVAEEAPAAEPPVEDPSSASADDPVPDEPPASMEPPPAADPPTVVQPPPAEPPPVAEEPFEEAAVGEPGHDPDESLGETQPHGFEALDEEAEEAEEPDPLASDPEAEDLDVLEDTPDFLQETPEHDRLWFEQKPPRDFDFD